MKQGDRGAGLEERPKLLARGVGRLRAVTRPARLGAFERSLLATGARHGLGLSTFAFLLHLSVSSLEATATGAPVLLASTWVALPTLLLLAAPFAGASSIARHLASGAARALDAAGVSEGVWTRPLAIGALGAGVAAFVAAECIAPRAARSLAPEPTEAAGFLWLDGWLVGSARPDGTHLILRSRGGVIDAFGLGRGLDQEGHRLRFEAIDWRLRPAEPFEDLVAPPRTALKAARTPPERLSLSELAEAEAASPALGRPGVWYAYARWGRLGLGVTTALLWLLSGLLVLLFGARALTALAIGSALALASWTASSVLEAAARAEALGPEAAALGVPATLFAACLGGAAALRRKGPRSPGQRP